MPISHIAWIVGVLYFLTGLSLALGGAPVRSVLARFPRHTPSGIVLAAIAIGWTAFLFWHSPLGWFEPYRRWLPLIAAIVYLLTIWLVNELLAPRALAGIMLLAAAPVLDSIRWEPTAWRFVLTVQAYIWIVTGMILIFGPHRFRLVCEWIYRRPKRTLWSGTFIVIAGLTMILLGATVFRTSRGP